MNAFIPDIETLKTVVKINANLPYDAISPYIDDALEIYIEPQIGRDLIQKILTHTDTELNQKILRTLGPLTLMLATPELGIRIGDGGITVDNEQGKRSPANEAKIAAAKDNFRFRGMQALDRLLLYLEQNRKAYPEYVIHTVQRFCFIRNAQEFQDKGMVNIEYSTLSYRIMYATIRQLQERNVREMVTDGLFEILSTGYNHNELTAKQQVLVDYIICYLANKTADLYTSQTSREQRTLNGTPEFSPLIRPVYQDQKENGNFFANQSSYYAGKIQGYLIENAADLGITTPATTLNFNSKEKKLFTSIS